MPDQPQSHLGPLSLPGTAFALLVSELLGLCASSMGHGVVLWWLASHSSGTALAGYSAAMAIAALVTLPLLSPLGDRRAKGPLILHAQLALGGVACVQCLLALTDALGWASITACGAAAALAMAALQPAQTAMLLEVATPQQLPVAIRVRRGLQALGSLCGPALAGVVLVSTSLQSALCLQAVLALLSAVAALRLGRHLTAPSPEPRAAWRHALQAGWRAKWRVRVDRWWTLTGALMMVFYGPAIGLLLPLRLQALPASPLWFGLCSSAFAAGVLAGVLGAADAVMVRMGRHRAMMLAVTLCGLCIVAIGYAERAPTVAGLLAVIGLCTAVTQLMGQTHRALAVPEDFRARMAAAQLSVAALSGVAAPLLAGLLLRWWPVAQVYGAMGGGVLLSALALWAIPDFRAFLAEGPEQARGWYERRYPGAFIRPSALEAQTGAAEQD